MKTTEEMMAWLEGAMQAMRVRSGSRGPRYFDLHGNQITAGEAAFTTSETRRVAKTVLPDGRVVSTVFLVLDHSFEGGPPLIFETMVFPSETDFTETDCARYSTLDEARRGHEKMVRSLTES